jgi:hypothetical protein
MRRTLISVSMTILGAGLLLAACTPTDGPGTAPPPKLSKSDVSPTGRVDQIAESGHGELFDADMRRIAIDEKTLLTLQDDLARQLELTSAPLDPAMAKLLASPRLSLAERYWLRAAQINAMLMKRDDKEGQRLMLLNHQLLRYSSRYRGLRLSDSMLARIRELLGQLVIPYNATDYIRRCREAGVPIPPDFSTTSRNWQDQGALTTNLLVPGDYAGVYTHHSRTVRGACVALPRGSGAPGSAAGIICQSATTGAACFWDNKLRSGGVGAGFMGWRDITLRIADLQDGDNLGDNCTRCHSGNNVYLVTPDDPTWGRLLRRTMAGTDHGNFTLRVRNSTDATSPANSGSPFRYVPISAQGWTNQRNAPGCAASCHEGVTASVMTRWSNHTPLPSMPPACAAGPGAPNHERCYVNPF